MQDIVKENFRTPNETEQFIIGRCARNMRIIYIESFIFFMALDLVSWYLMFLFLFSGDNWSIGIYAFIFALVLGLASLASWLVVKELGKTKTYQICSAKGEWSIKSEGSGKTKEFFSTINGDKVTMVVPGMAIGPEYGEAKNIEYEYVKILEDAPLFGYNNIFISIDGKGFSGQHKEYIAQLKPIGILSVILSVCFFVALIFCVLIGFNITWLNYTCLGLFFIFSKTAYTGMGNYLLRKKMEYGQGNRV